MSLVPTGRVLQLGPSSWLEQREDGTLLFVEQGRRTHRLRRDSFVGFVLATCTPEEVARAAGEAGRNVKVGDLADFIGRLLERANSR